MQGGCCHYTVAFTLLHKDTNKHGGNTTHRVVAALCETDQKPLTYLPLCPGPTRQRPAMTRPHTGGRQVHPRHRPLQGIPARSHMLLCTLPRMTSGVTSLCLAVAHLDPLRCCCSRHCITEWHIGLDVKHGGAVNNVHTTQHHPACCYIHIKHLQWWSGRVRHALLGVVVEPGSRQQKPASGHRKDSGPPATR